MIKKILFFFLFFFLSFQLLTAQEKKYPESYDKGNVFLKNKMYTQAIEQYEKSIQEAPSFAQAYLNIGICYDQYLHDMGKAVDYYVLYLQNGGEKVDQVKKWIGNIANLKYITTDREFENLQKAVEFYNAGVELSKKSKYIAAIEEFNKSLKIAPYYVRARYIVGMAYFMTKQYADAYENFTKVILYDPDSKVTTQVYYYLALLYDDLLLKDYGTALQFYKQYRIKDGSKNVSLLMKPLEELENLIDQAKTLFDQKKYSDAIIVLEKGLEIKPQDVRLYNNLAVNCMKQKKYPKAEEYLKKALSIRNNVADTYYNLACLYSQEGDTEKALEYFQGGAKYYSQEMLKNSLMDEDLKDLQEDEDFVFLVKSLLK